MAAGSPVDAPPPPAEPPRSGVDRRQRPTPMFSRYLLFGRRRGGRRDGERERIYVDRPGPWVTAAFLAVCLLSVADAYLTLHELSRGATEANPVMRAALDLGNGGFVLVKTLMTVLGAAFLGLHKTWPLGRVCLGIAVAGYLLLTGWHMYGLFWVLPSTAT
ncbi:MAG: DUF5658 family protein [Planctomycetota bacterium]